MWNVDNIRKAWILASCYHNGQKYGGEGDGEQIEYLEHLGSVMIEIQNVIQHDKTIKKKELAILCAILHDILEDSDCSPDEIRQRFGTEVLEGVQALTKDNSIESKEDKMLDSLKRINALKTPEVGMVKLADRICNLAAPPFYWTKEKMMSYVEEARVIHGELMDCNEYLADRLLSMIERYEINYLGRHFKDYKTWSLDSLIEFEVGDLKKFISQLQERFGENCVVYKTQVIGYSLKIISGNIELSISINEEWLEEGRLSLGKNKISNESHIAFLKQFVDFIYVKSIEYWFENKTLGESKGFIIN